MVWPTLGLRTAKEQNRTAIADFALYYFLLYTNKCLYEECVMEDGSVYIVLKNATSYYAVCCVCKVELSAELSAKSQTEELLKK